MTSWIEGSGNYTVISKVEHGNDDALSQGATYPGVESLYSGSYVSIGASTTSHYCSGLRFTDLPILQGAIIESASLTLCCYSSVGPDSFNVIIAGEDVDDGAEWDAGHTPAAAYASKTASSVTETISTTWTAGAYYTLSADLKDIVQEIIDRAGWTARNALNLILYPENTSLPATDNYRRCRSFEYTGNLYGAVLSIVVTGSGTDAPPRTYYMRADGTSTKSRSTGVDDASHAFNITVHHREAFSPGDVIILSNRGGDFVRASNPIIYSGGGNTTQAWNGLPDHPIKYLGETGYRPTLDGQNITAQNILVPNGRQYHEFENFLTTNPTTSGIEWQGNSIGVVRKVESTNSGNQAFQQIGTSSVEYYDIIGDDGADDGFSMHDDSVAVIHGGKFRGNPQGINIIANTNLTGYDIEISASSEYAVWIAAASGGSRQLILERFAIDAAGTTYSPLKFESGSTATLRFGWIKGHASLATVSPSSGSTVAIDHTVLDGPGSGTGIDTATADLTLTNSVITGFVAGVNNGSGSALTGLSHNCFYNNTDDFTGSPTPSSTVSVFDDPLFVDAANDDYHLQTGSPCIDAGTDTGATADYYGQTEQGSAWDIGLAEYVSSGETYEQSGVDGGLVGDSAQVQSDFLTGGSDGFIAGDAGSSALNIDASGVDGLQIGDAGSGRMDFDAAGMDGSLSGGAGFSQMDAIAEALDGLMAGDLASDLTSTIQLEAEDGGRVGDAGQGLVDIQASVLDGMLTRDSASGEIAGFDFTHRVGSPDLVDTPNGILLVFDYADEVQEDGTELNNIYFSSSTDGGSTWSDPSALTDYAVFGRVGLHPSAIDRNSGEVELVYHEKTEVLHADDSMNNWQTECGAGNSYGTDMHCDPATGLLYVLQIYTYVGVKRLCGVVVLDTETWSVVRNYNSSTVPAYNSLFNAESVWPHRNCGDGHYVCFSVTGNNKVACVIDDEAETVTHFVFEDWPTYGLTKNVDITFPPSMGSSIQLFATQVDAANNRLYVMFVDSYLYTPGLMLGYIDLAQTPDPIKGYSWTQCFVSTNTNEIEILGLNTFKVYPELDLVLLGSDAGGTLAWTGRCWLYQLSSGGLVHSFKPSTDPGFAYRGTLYPVILDGHIYASFTYEANYGNADRRGLMDIDLATGGVTYHRPTWATLDNYGLGVKAITPDGRIAIASSHGITIFDPADQSWELFDNAALPGLTPSGADLFGSVVVDPLTGVIYGGVSAYPTANWYGVVAFKEEGSFEQVRSMTGSYDSGWSWSDPEALTVGLSDYDMAVAEASDDVLWALWTRDDESELSLKWDKEGLETDLTNYQTGPVRISWRIDGASRLEFSLAQGHRFEPSALPSVFHEACGKGRRILASMGERVAGTDYLQLQGEWIVQETSLTYRRGDHPVLSVRCEDRRALWSEMNVVASEYFSGSDPDEVIQSLLFAFTDLTEADLNLPTLTTGHEIYHQFVDMSLMEMIQDLLDHFDYFAHFQTDGKFTLVPVSFKDTPDHVYASTAKISDYSPDDSYSSNVNRVVIEGESRSWIEVLYDEEPVGEASGTVGWWGGKEELVIWYSEDHQQACRDPRLVVDQSVRDFSLFLVKGGGSEYISSVDPDEFYCVITINRPNLVGALIAALAALAAIGYAAITCTVHCGGYLYAMSIILSLILGIISAVAQYAYTVYAKPVGREKQQIQAQADDYDYQRILGGQVIETRIDDSLSDTVQICQQVADREMALVKYQRRRSIFSKPAHLADEIGDTLRLPHPYYDLDLDVFVTELERTWEKGVGVTDQVTGWRRS